VRFAHELITEGYVGDVLVANMSVISSGQFIRGKGRIWQSQRKNGANPLTIAGGHSIDATRFLVGDFVDIAARVTTQTREWLDSDTGHAVDVDAPDTIGVVARTPSGAEVTMQIATVPTAAPGSRLEIYGTAGRLVLTSPSSFSTGPNRLLGAKAKDELTELAIPSRLVLAPATLVDAPPSINVAQAYVRFAEDRAAGRRIDPDFETALGMHRIIDAIEKAADRWT
jgi:predicted dehydrogenase